MKDTVFTGTPATLAQLLASREQRAAQQKNLLTIWRVPVVCVLCNLPGAVKNCPAGDILFLEATQALYALLEMHEISIVYDDAQNHVTGAEAFVCACAGAETLKRICCEIEETHPLGRLFDLDVIGLDGVPLSRTQLCFPKRRCLVCGGDAASCVSRQLHPLSDVQAVILSMLKQYGTADFSEDV